MAEVIENVVIDPNSASYAAFFDRDWSKRMFDAVATSPLKAAVDALMVAWRSANGAHMLPWLMVESLKAFAADEGRGSLRVRAGYSQQVIKGISTKLVETMQYQLNVEQRAALKRAVAKIEREAFEARSKALSEIAFETASYWQFLTRLSEFQFSILGTQRTNYAALFFAYEDFLANAIRTKEPTYSSRGRHIGNDLSGHFGEDLANFYWNDDEVELGRLVRNALAHNGGRFGAALEKYRSRFEDATDTDKPVLRAKDFLLVDGVIQITPDNTAHLFGVLKDRVTKVVENVA